jgi:O-antigen/teichoic acid export membrane protein
MKSDSNLIAKNTFILYIRMFLTMAVSLYTSRVVLNTLGVQDYGVYSIVGGIVTLFGFINGAMTSATQRFLAFDIGKNDTEQLKKTFNATLNIHITISILVLILAETIGLWFVNNKLNLPLDRMDAVNWVYQFSVFTFLLGIIQVPYDALITAREKFNIYAYMSFIEAFLKLVIVYLLFVFAFDKLILYAALLFLVSFIVRMGHMYYCKRNFEESKYQFYFDKSFYKVLLSFSGWSLFGGLAAIARGQGVNVLLNLFFGTILNAAFGITMQIQVTVNNFVLNFQMAVNPQIIKSYALGDKERYLKLIFQSAKLSFFLLCIIVFPIIFNIDLILELWLKNPPKHTSILVILTLIGLLIESISGPLIIAAQATGKIKWYQIFIGTLIILNLPIAYLLLKVNKYPELVLYTSILISILSLFFRIVFLKNIMDFPIISFCRDVLLRILIVTILILLCYYFFYKFFFIKDSIYNFIIGSLVLGFITVSLIYLLGINEIEKRAVKKIILNNLTSLKYTTT